MVKLTQEDVMKLRTAVSLESENSWPNPNAIEVYQELTRKLRIEENPEDVLSILTTVLQKGSEAGEIQGKIAKSIRDKRNIWRMALAHQEGSMTPKLSEILDAETYEAVVKELGDDLFYISEMCNHLGITLFDLMIDNIEKLASRDQRGTLGGSGDNR